MPLLLIFIVLPLIEIALFIAVGGQIGLLPTLALIALGAFVGVSILRGQSVRAQAMMQGGLRIQPGTFLAEGAFRVLAGLLLIVPGFLSDSIGLVLLVPPLQRAIMRGIAARATVSTTRVYRDGDIVEGDYEVRDPQGRTVQTEHWIDDRRGR